MLNSVLLSDRLKVKDELEDVMREPLGLIEGHAAKGKLKERCYWVCVCVGAMASHVALIRYIIFKGVEIWKTNQGPHL